MKTRRRILILVLALYVLGLGWGYVRLPWAAIKSLADFELIAKKPAVTISDARVSLVQLWYLKQALKESPVTVEPRVSVQVTWNALIVARVRSGHYLAPLAAEGCDRLYFCLFGLWIPAYTYSHEMA